MVSQRVTATKQWRLIIRLHPEQIVQPSTQLPADLSPADFVDGMIQQVPRLPYTAPVPRVGLLLVRPLERFPQAERGRVHVPDGIRLLSAHPADGHKHSAPQLVNSERAWSVEFREGPVGR